MVAHRPTPGFDRLDRRHTGYRFDLDRDLPWEQSEAPGLWLGPHLRSCLGLATHLPEPAEAALQWGFALATAQAFVALERDVCAFGQGVQERLPSRSLERLLQEEDKHIRMFQRLADDLRGARPEWVDAFDAVWRAPVGWQDVLRLSSTQDPRQLDGLVWLATLFFEEYTVWIHHALAADAERIQPLWLAAHACHRREEAQHVLTDAAYFGGLGLSPEEGRSLGRAFSHFLERQLDSLLCLQVVQAFVQRLGGPPVLQGQRSLSALGLKQVLLQHTAFQHSRRIMFEVEAAPTATLVDYLQRAAHHPDRPELIFLSPGGQEERWTYQELMDRAVRRQSGLVRLGLGSGDMVLLMTPAPQDFLPTFWACVLQGILPAPLAPPSTTTRADGQFDRLQAVHRSTGCAWVITDEAMQPGLQRIIDDSGLKMTVVRADGLDGDAASPGPIKRSAEDLAFVQFSSGSTKAPRGVRLSHANLIANAEGMLAHRSKGAKETFVSWLPLFHDMGLIGYHVTPLVHGATQVLMTPERFVRNPVSWLRALDKYGGTITGGSNFALSHLLSRVRERDLEGLDLSRVHCWLIGAEPISHLSLQGIMQALGPLGLPADALCPGYGLAEATLAVTMTPRAQAPWAWSVDRDSLAQGERVRGIDADHPRACALVACGTPIVGLRVRVVDEGGQPQPEHVVGEIQVRGPTVTVGLWQQPDGPPGPGQGWLSTGDLGVFHEGELFVTGRLRDTFFVAGRTLYAHDVEVVAGEVPLVRPGCVALVVHPADARGVERRTLCIVPTQREGTRALMEAVTRHVAARTGVALDEVRCVKRADLPRTTSGKLQRFKLGQRLREGGLDDAPIWTPGAPALPVAGSEHLQRVRAVWSEVLAVAEVGLDADFYELGGTSLRAADVHARLEQVYACALGPELLTHGRTVRSMAEALARELQAAATARVPATGVARVAPVAASPSPREPSDAVAVVGLAVRLPGAPDAQGYWTLLLEGGCAISDIPGSRFDSARLLEQLGPRIDALQGAFIERVEDFDPAPFGLSDEVAKALDPQQRLWLEVAFEALGQAVAPTRRVGVFVATGDNEYALRYVAAPQLAGPHALLGALHNMVAARVSQVFGLTGPSLTVDSACSSSLAAVHLAVQSIRAGDCELALAGGVQLNLTDQVWRYFASAGLLAKDGRCRPFDRDASGLVPGEGAACVLLKPLKAALRDHDRVWGVIRGSAMNNDGGALSGTAPNPAGQREVIRRAWATAGQSPGRASYVEAHAAGTMIGDAMEAATLAEVFSQAPRLPIGSVKSNVGHTFAVSGVAGLLKVLLAFEHELLPPTVGCAHPAERIRFEATNLQPLLRAVPWPRGATPRWAGVDAFGLGGTNVHLVLEEPPTRTRWQALPALPLLFTHAGANPPDLGTGPSPEPGRTELAAHAAAASRRAQYGGARRAAVLAGDQGWQDILPELEAGLEAGLAAPCSRLAWVIPGPGSQRPDMGSGLMAEPAFGEAWRVCEAAFGAHGIDLGAARTAPQVDRIEAAQPAVFAFAYASWRWLSALGAEAVAVLGHSAGEVLAAHIAGVFELADAVRLVAARAEAMARAPRGGAAVVFAEGARVETLLRTEDLRVGIAAKNAPTQTLVSGSEQELLQALAAFEAAGFAARRLAIHTPAHSALMAPVAEHYRAQLADIRMRAPRLPWISSLTGRTMGTPDPEYWARQLTEPVLFEQAVQEVLRHEVDTFVELGATAGLTACVEQIVPEEVAAMSLGHKELDERVTGLRVVGRLWVGGLDLRLQDLEQGQAAPASLPPRTFRRRRLWIDAPPPDASVPAGLRLIGGQIVSIEDHRMAGRCTAPASWLMDHALAGLPQRVGVGLKKVVVGAPLLLSTGEARLLQLDHSPGHVEVSSCREGSGGSTVHLQAEVELEPERLFDRIDLGAVRARCTRHVEPRDVYALLAASGFEVGQRMRAVRAVQVGLRELVVELQTPLGGDAGRCIDPALLDGASQAVAAYFVGGAGATNPFLGFSVGALNLWAPVKQACTAVVRLRSVVEETSTALRYDILLTNPQGELLAEVRDFGAKRQAPAAARQLSRSRPAAPAATRGPGPAAVSPPGPGELPPQSVQEVLRDEVARRVRRPPASVGLDQDLARLGLDSMKAVDLVAALERRYGLALPATFLFEVRTIREAASHLSGLLQAPS